MSEQTKIAHVIYFGCMDQGHHAHRPGGEKLRFGVHHTRKYQWIQQLDGFLPPQGVSQLQGAATFHSIHGFSIVSFWDRSQDTRPGSSSTFFVEGAWTYEETLERALEAFPKVFARFMFDIVPYQEG